MYAKVKSTAALLGCVNVSVFAVQTPLVNEEIFAAFCVCADQKAKLLVVAPVTVTVDDVALAVSVFVPDTIFAKFALMAWKATLSVSPVPSFAVVPTLTLENAMLFIPW
jgi:hypothetical protein